MGKLACMGGKHVVRRCGRQERSIKCTDKIFDVAKTDVRVPWKVTDEDGRICWEADCGLWSKVSDAL